MPQINPEHTVPTIVDHNNDKFALWESRAIVTYLVDKYSPGHTLYPSDVTTRAQINHWLFFDLGTLFSAFHAAAVPHILMGAPLDEAKVATLKEKLKLVDGALHGKEYLVTDHHTVADLQLLVLITTMESLEIPDLSQFPSITNWVQRLKKEVQGYEEINQAGIDGMKDFIPLLRESLQQQQQ